MYFSDLLNILFLLPYLKGIKTATIGDGSRSLYTGEPIDVNNTRGSCLADGVLYYSETSIPRDHPCHYCICFQSQVSCYWKQCAAPPVNCVVMEFENVCNPSLYVCEIPQKAIKEPVLEFGARLNAASGKRKLRRRRPSLGGNDPERVIIRRGVRIKRGLRMPIAEDPTLIKFQDAWEKYLESKESHRIKRAIGKPSSGFNRLLKDTSCTVFGVPYNLGEVIGVASDVCMECRCAAGEMFCSPKCCFLPSPFSVGTPGENALFVLGRSRDAMRPPHPLHYVRNQFEEGPFLR
ncbi:UNVERIFIED_CONTAM: hypothetical protein RMT77_014524 [Armadillidium vulgare]